MRSICIIGVSISAGQLFSNGIIKHDTFQWVLALIIFISFCGYIWRVHYDFKKQINDILKKH